ncbi:MAG: ligase-associated DNA damage response exonuclease [Desulfobacterales bacterium]|jgi:putative mRNA 3-end processing factor
MNGVLELTPSGLYCRRGEFYIDPWRPVKRAVITHAHADHARLGSDSYLCVKESKLLLQSTLGYDANIQTLEYGEVLTVNSTKLSLHPAGHILGSAQVKIVKNGRICVVTGDYKQDLDPTCSPLEPLRCNFLISECTFGLPIFRWPSPEQVIQEINLWWRANRELGRTSILFAYALGKAQRILAGLDSSIGPILTHGAVEKISHCYRDLGVSLPETRYIGDLESKDLVEGALVIAPPSADNPAWMRRFPIRSRAFASGWMRIRGNRRRRSVDRGFILSDHSDWDGLVETIAASGAERILVTHGYATEMVRWLQENGYDAEIIPTAYRDEADIDGEEA